MIKKASGLIHKYIYKKDLIIKWTWLLYWQYNIHEDTIIYNRNLQLPMRGQGANQQTLGRLNLPGIICLRKVNQ